MAHTRFDNLDDEKQQRIIDAAGEEFAEKGYEGASINRIIKQAGISKGSLYYYFEDKADLFATVVTYASEKIMKATTGIDFSHLTAETYWESLRSMGQQGMAQAVESPWFMRFTRVFYEHYDTSDTHSPASKVVDWSLNVAMSLIKRGQELEVVRTDLPSDYLAACLLGLGEGMGKWAVAHWDSLSEQDFKNLQEAKLDLMRRILTP